MAPNLDDILGPRGGAPAPADGNPTGWAPLGQGGGSTAASPPGGTGWAPLGQGGGNLDSVLGPRGGAAPGPATASDYWSQLSGGNSSSQAPSAPASAGDYWKQLSGGWAPLGQGGGNLDSVLGPRGGAPAAKKSGGKGLLGQLGKLLNPANLVKGVYHLGGEVAQSAGISPQQMVEHVKGVDPWYTPSAATVQKNSSPGVNAIFGNQVNVPANPQTGAPATVKGEKGAHVFAQQSPTLYQAGKGLANTVQGLPDIAVNAAEDASGSGPGLANSIYGRQIHQEGVLPFVVGTAGNLAILAGGVGAAGEAAGFGNVAEAGRLEGLAGRAATNADEAGGVAAGTVNTADKATAAAQAARDAGDQSMAGEYDSAAQNLSKAADLRGTVANRSTLGQAAEQVTAGAKTVSHFGNQVAGAPAELYTKYIPAAVRAIPGLGDIAANAASAAADRVGSLPVVERLQQNADMRDTLRGQRSETQRLATPVNQATAQIRTLLPDAESQAAAYMSRTGDAATLNRLAGMPDAELQRYITETPWLAQQGATPAAFRKAADFVATDGAGGTANLSSAQAANLAQAHQIMDTGIYTPKEQRYAAGYGDRQTPSPAALADRQLHVAGQANSAGVEAPQVRTLLSHANAAAAWATDRANAVEATDPALAAQLRSIAGELPSSAAGLPEAKYIAGGTAAEPAPRVPGSAEPRLRSRVKTTSEMFRETDQAPLSAKGQQSQVNADITTRVRNETPRVVQQRLGDVASNVAATPGLTGEALAASLSEAKAPGGGGWTAWDPTGTGRRLDPWEVTPQSAVIPTRLLDKYQKWNGPAHTSLPGRIYDTASAVARPLKLVGTGFPIHKALADIVTNQALAGVSPIDVLGHAGQALQDIKTGTLPADIGAMPRRELPAADTAGQHVANVMRRLQDTAMAPFRGIDTVNRDAVYRTLTERGYSPQTAAEMTRKAGGDLGSMNPGEKAAGRRLFTYYPWQRHLADVATSLPVAHPAGLAEAAAVAQADERGRPNQPDTRNGIEDFLNPFATFIPLAQPTGNQTRGQAISRMAEGAINPILSVGAGLGTGLNLRTGRYVSAPGESYGQPPGPMILKPAEGARYALHTFAPQIAQGQDVAGGAGTPAGFIPYRYDTGQAETTGASRVQPGTTRLDALARLLGLPHAEKVTPPKLKRGR